MLGVGLMYGPYVEYWTHIVNRSLWDGRDWVRENKWKEWKSSFVALSCCHQCNNFQSRLFVLFQEQRIRLLCFFPVQTQPLSAALNQFTQENVHRTSRCQLYTRQWLTLPRGRVTIKIGWSCLLTTDLSSAPEGYQPSACCTIQATSAYTGH